MRLKSLTYEQIQQFVGQVSSDKDKLAVEDFLMSVKTNLITFTALVNLASNRSKYKWDEATVKAILAGIALADN